MKKTLLMLALVAGITSFAQNATAALIALSPVPDAYGPNQRVLSFNGSSLSFANWTGDFAWQFYVSAGGMGPAGMTISTLFANTVHRFDDSSSLVAGVSSIGPSSTPTQFFPFISTSFSNRYFGLIYEAGGGNYNYGWANLSYDASSNIATMNSAAMQTTVNQSILVGDGPSAAVPEPGTWAAAALLAGGAGFMRWRKRAKVA
jgi:hypothetical protein